MARRRGRGAVGRTKPPSPPPSDEEDPDLAEAIRLSLDESQRDPEAEDLKRAIRESLKASGAAPPPVDTPDESAQGAVDAESDEPGAEEEVVVISDDPSSGDHSLSSTLATGTCSDAVDEGPSSSSVRETRGRPEIQVVTANHRSRRKNPVFGRVEGHIRHVFSEAQLPAPSIKKMELVLGHVKMEREFDSLQRAWRGQANRSSEAILYFHCGLGATDESALVLKHNLSPNYATGLLPYGPGLYFSIFPSIEEVSEFKLLVCQVLKGRECVEPTSDAIPNGFNHKNVFHPGPVGASPEASLISRRVIVIASSRQVQPLGIVHCSFAKKTLQGWGGRDLRHHLYWLPKETYGYDLAKHLQDIMSGSAEVAESQIGEDQLNDDQVVKSLQKMFEPSLKLHENGQFMKASPAIKTSLYPHQMFALAWMAHRENHKMDGVRGGILADDMGLGKTLSILALILSNFHDKRPLARPLHGFVRILPKEVQKYLPQRQRLGGADLNRGGNLLKKAEREVGSRCTSKADPASLDLSKLMGNMDQDQPRHKEKKDMYQRVKSSKRAGGVQDVPIVKTLDEKLEDVDESLIALDSDDEFDSMVSTESLAEKLGVDSNHDLTSQKSQSSSLHHHDGLSDDEEYQKMSVEERNQRLKPTLNVDGAIELSSESEPELPQSTSEGYERKKRPRGSKLHSGSRVKSQRICEDEMELPDLTAPSELAPTEMSPPKLKVPFVQVVPELTAEERKRLIIPRKDPAICGSRRRATLLVTPSSLISHWIEQIETHVDKRVELKMFVHHGQSKALIGKELEDHDVVITTYGTLMSEFNTGSTTPLLKCKWLRVCLDEGHMIKNHRAKTSKAAQELDTQRKWIISGTPIQNNLAELWSLLSWLELEPYAGSRPLFKLHIEHPIKHGHPHGVERLQTLVRAICMRRTKADKVNGKPLVVLPSKTVEVKNVEFRKEERVVYDGYLNHGREIIARYMRRGTLLKNYAHVFAVMMRLRQLCCHRDLLPVNWHEINLDELDELAKKDLTPLEGMDPDQVENGKRLAEHLREMIRNGISDECAICLGDFDHPVITPCAHIYCRPCITTHIESVRPPAQCPLCRGDILASQLLEAAPSDEDDLDGDDKDQEKFEDIVVAESSSKINALIRQIEIDRHNGEEGKVIIVSQFTSLLSIIQPLLTDRNFEWSRLDGSMSAKQRSTVVAEFQDESAGSPEVLLLSLRAGGVGLNLTAATRMFLLDPAWNPSTEEQCFDRMHRLGQKRDVRIIKFIMTNSIEERMMAIQDKKRNLISGAFRQNEAERRQQRIQDIRDVFGL